MRYSDVSQCHVQDPIPMLNSDTIYRRYMQNAAWPSSPCPTHTLGLIRECGSKLKIPADWKYFHFQCIPPPSTAGYFWKAFLHQFLTSTYYIFQARNEYGWSQPSEMFSFTTSQKNIQSEFASTTTSTHTNATKIIICFFRVFLSYFCYLKCLKPPLARKC